MAKLSKYRQRVLDLIPAGETVSREDLEKKYNHEYGKGEFQLAFSWLLKSGYLVSGDSWPQTVRRRTPAEIHEFLIKNL